MRTSLRLGSFCLLATLATGCTIVTSDPGLDDAGDTGLVADSGTDTIVDDTGTTDTTPDAPPVYGVIIQANTLLGLGEDDMKDFGGGSTFLDITAGNRLYNAVAVYESGGTKIESTTIGRGGAGYVDGKMVGLPTDKGALTITVTGYLRGLNGNDAATPNTRVPWARSTCTVTPSATADVIATCNKLALIPDLKGILFSSDVLPDGYCAGKGATDFEILRARTPATGTSVVSKTTNDCQGVIWVPESEFATQEVNGVTTWNVALEAKSSSLACTLKSPYCRIDRGTGGSKLDIYVVGSACRLDPTTSEGGTCF